MKNTEINYEANAALMLAETMEQYAFTQTYGIKTGIKRFGE